MNNLSRCLVIILCLVFMSHARSEVIYNIKFSPPSPASLPLNEHLNITFNYTSTQPDGIRIFVIPITNGEPPPLYAVSPSPLYPAGSGIGSGYVTILSGDVVVDSILFMIKNSDEIEVLMQFYVPVNFHFSENAFTDIVMTPTSPAPLQFMNLVTMTFNYTTSQAAGVRIQPIPYTHGHPTPHYGVSSSILHPVGSGSISKVFTIMSGDTLVDSVQLRMYDSSFTIVLLEIYIPVQYHFANNAISNVQCDISSPAALPLGQDLNFTFNYTSNHSGGGWIFTRPFTHGALSPNYAASGGAPFDSGDGSGTGYFTIDDGDVWVDSIRFQMTNSEQSVVLLDYFVPVTYHFGNHAITNIHFSPTSPAYFTNGPLDTCTFNYTTNEPESVVIDAVPFSDGSKTPHSSWSPSPFSPPGTGSDTTDFNVLSGNAVVDSIRFRMYDSTLSEVLFEFFVPVDFYYGSGIPVGVKKYNSDISSSFRLSQNYPNPFNPNTMIEYQLPRQSHVTLRVYDVLGREVATLVNRLEAPGHKSVIFDASRFASGVYYYRLQAGNFIETKKLVLLK